MAGAAIETIFEKIFIPIFQEHLLATEQIPIFQEDIFEY